MRLSRLLLPVVLCGAALAAPQAAGAAVSVGQSGWFWGSPLPQGNTLGAVELTGGRPLSWGPLPPETDEGHEGCAPWRADAGGGTRTPKLLRAPAPKAGLCTSSSTPAGCMRSILDRGQLPPIEAASSCAFLRMWTA